LYFAALVLLLLSFGCSSNDKKDDSATSKSSSDESTTSTLATTTTIKPPKGATGGDLEAFCTAYKDIQKLGYGEFKGTADQQKAAIRDHYTKVGEAGKRMQAAAPREIKHVVDVAMDINDDVVSSGSVKPFDSEENKQNGPLLAAYADQQCKAVS
jgi:hypothetical protein